MFGRAATMLLVLALVPLGGTSQEAPPPFLLVLKGQAAYVNYTPGALDRAIHIQRRIELVAVDFSKLTKMQIRVRVFVLSRDEWGQFGFGLPYGLPGRIRGTTLAVASLGDPGTVSLWTDILGVAPPPLPGIPIKGTAQEASTLAMGDLLTQVETARILLSSGGIRGEVGWVQQVLAHLVARVAFERYESARLENINNFFAQLGQGASGHTLAQYSQGLDLKTLLWFESRFHQGARLVLEGGKKNEGRELFKAAVKNGGLVTEQMMLERYPQLRVWLDEAFEN
jgi:hypothetical protein